MIYGDPDPFAINPAQQDVVVLPDQRADSPQGPGGLDLWEWLKRWFTSSGGSSSAASGAGKGYVAGQVAGTEAAALGGGGAAAPAAGGFTWADAASGGAAIADQYSKNKNAKADRQLTLQELQLQELQGFEAALQARERLRLDQESSARTAQTDAYSKAMLGTVGRTVQDVAFDRSGFQSRVPAVSFTGGSRPSILDGAGRANAAVLEAQGTAALRNPTPTPVLPPQERIKFWEAVDPLRRRDRGRMSPDDVPPPVSGGRGR